MDEPKEGATTLKKKAQEKLAAKANPVEETPVVEAVVEASEPEAVVEVVVSEPVAVAEVAEVPAQVVETDVVIDTPEEEAK
jgi:small subunit ribosomal protein S16